MSKGSGSCTSSGLSVGAATLAQLQTLAHTIAAEAVFDAALSVTPALLAELARQGADLDLLAILRQALGTAVGMLTGSVTGLVAGEVGAAAGLAAGAVAGPVGAAVGLSLGALAGLIVDLSHSGVNLDFVDEVSRTLLPGKTAVVAEVEESWETPVNTRLGSLGGLVFRRLRSEVVEDQLTREATAFEAELREINAELAQAPAEAKAALQQQVEQVKSKLAATQAQAEARQQQLKSESDAKVAALQAQMKEANERRKAQIERRMAEVKADFAARSAKLDQARKLILEALSR